jgi:hypothetical protein
MLINFLKGFLLANPDIPGSFVYDAAWLEFNQLLTREQLDGKFTDALEKAHRQIIREGR